MREGATLLKTKMTHMFVSVSGWPSLSPQTLVPLCEESGPTMSWLCPVAARGGYSKDFSTIKCRIIFVFKLLWNISNQWLCKWLWENIVKYRKHDKNFSSFHNKKMKYTHPWRMAMWPLTLSIDRSPGDHCRTLDLLMVLIHHATPTIRNYGYYLSELIIFGYWF